MAQTFTTSTQVASAADKGLLLERARHWQKIQSLVDKEPGRDVNSPQYLKWLQLIAECSDQLDNADDSLVDRGQPALVRGNLGDRLHQLNQLWDAWGQPPSGPNTSGGSVDEAAKDDDEISVPSSIPASMRQSESSDETDEIEEEEFRAASEDEIEVEITDISISPPQNRKEKSLAPTLSFVKPIGSATPPRPISPSQNRKEKSLAPTLSFVKPIGSATPPRPISPSQNRKEKSLAPTLSFVKPIGSATPPRPLFLPAPKKTNRAVQQQLSGYLTEMDTSLPTSVPMDCDWPEIPEPSTARGTKLAFLCDGLSTFGAMSGRNYAIYRSKAELKDMIELCRRNEIRYQSAASSALFMHEVLKNKHSDQEVRRKEIENQLQEMMDM